MSDGPAAERERIEQAYRARDAAGASAAYSFANPAYVLGMHELEHALLAALVAAGAPLGGRVLDVGAGSGYFLHRLREYGAAEAIGVELTASRVEEGRRRYPRLDLREGDASALEFEDGEFDVVTQFTVLSSVLDPGVRRAIAGEMWRVARPGGFVVSVDMLPRPAARRMVDRLRGRGAPAGPTPVQGLSRADVSALFPAPPAATRWYGLHMGLAPIAARSRTVAQLIAALPPARTHLVAVFRKPGGATADAGAPR